MITVIRIFLAVGIIAAVTYAHPESEIVTAEMTGISEVAPVFFESEQPQKKEMVSHSFRVITN